MPNTYFKYKNIPAKHNNESGETGDFTAAILILGVSPGFTRGRAFHGSRLKEINSLETASRRYNHSP